MIFRSYWKGSSDHVCWTVRYWTAVIRRCVDYVVTWMLPNNRSLWTNPGGAKHLFKTYRLIWILKSWHLAIGNREGSNLSAQALNLPNTLLCRTSCLEWWDAGGLSLPPGQTLKDLSAPSRWLNIFRMYIFQVYGWGQGWFLICMVSLANCLLSWSIIIKFELLAWGGCWKCCVCKLYLWHGYCVPLLYFPNTDWILLCKKGYNCLLCRTIFRLCFVLVVMEFYL